MRLFAGVLLCASLLASPLSREFDENLIAFYRPFELFLRHYQGCPDAGPVDATNCKPEQIRFDYRAFAKSRKAAERLFAPDR